MEIFIFSSLIVVDLPWLYVVNLRYEFGVKTQPWHHFEHLISILRTAELSFKLISTESEDECYSVVDLTVYEWAEHQSNYKLAQVHIVAILLIEHRPDSPREIQFGSEYEIGDHGTHELTVPVRV